jgi:hypothetical protein
MFNMQLGAKVFFFFVGLVILFYSLSQREGEDCKHFNYFIEVNAITSLKWMLLHFTLLGEVVALH